MASSILKSFLKSYWKEGKPLLVGFSGGPDSMALLHLLLECNLDLHVAHVDHGWRSESGEEAKKLEAHVNALHLPFHTTRLENIPPKEEAARQARLKFFQEIYQKYDCQALVLGHHGDDQSETVLKRILEGASFLALSGILPVTQLQGMAIWRPLLKVDKQILRKVLSEKGLEALEDSTNLDPRYLRGRMRGSILPELAREFGKEVASNLRRLGESAQELAEYFNRRLEKYQIIETQDEFKVDFTTPLEPFEVKIFLKKFTEQNNIFLSHAALQTLYELIEKGTLHRRVGKGERWVEVRGRSIAIKKIYSY